jgi:H+/Cl- antiporter ClcA
MACYQPYYWYLTGSASAGFLQSLEWATNFRENHLWLIALLPIAGFLIGLLYYYWGKDVEAEITF